MSEKSQAEIAVKVKRIGVLFRWRCRHGPLRFQIVTTQSLAQQLCGMLERSLEADEREGKVDRTYCITIDLQSNDLEPSGDMLGASGSPEISFEQALMLLVILRLELAKKPQKVECIDYVDREGWPDHRKWIDSDTKEVLLVKNRGFVKWNDELDDVGKDELEDEEIE